MPNPTPEEIARGLGEHGPTEQNIKHAHGSIVHTHGVIGAGLHWHTDIPGDPCFTFAALVPDAKELEIQRLRAEVGRLRASAKLAEAAYFKARDRANATQTSRDEAFARIAELGAALRGLLEWFGDWPQDMTCEAHPGKPWPHDDCIGPGMPWGALEGLIAAEREKREELVAALHEYMGDHALAAQQEAGAITGLPAPPDMLCRCGLCNQARATLARADRLGERK